MGAALGKRRYGFLTNMQWDYVEGNLFTKNKKGKIVKMSKTRQRIEDYYIMKSIETTLEQLKDIDFWLWKKENRLLYYDEDVVKAIEQSCQAVRGKKIKRSHKFRLNGQCPYCHKPFSAEVAADKGRVKWSISSFGGTVVSPSSLKKE